MIYIIINLCCYILFNVLFYFMYPRVNFLTYIDSQLEDDRNDKYHKDKVTDSKNNILSVRYIQVNYLKSLCLMIFSPFVMYAIYSIIYFEYIPYFFIVIMGAIYSSLDMSAIFYNPVCHQSTLVHHISVQLLYIYCVWNNWMFYSLASCITLYACFSTLSYLVNFRLSIRESNNPYEQVINDLSLCIYSTNSVLNWLVQLYYIVYYFSLFDDYIVFKLFYILTVMMIIYDDIFLMKYLYKNISLKYYYGYVENGRCSSLFEVNK